MINGIPYPISIDLKKVIEEKRREFAESLGVKPRSVSQARFSKLLVPIIKQGKINVRPIINKNVFKKARFKTK